MADILPACSLDKIRQYLQSIGYIKVDRHSTADREVWASKDRLNIVYVPVDEDPVSFANVLAMMEGQLKKGVFEIPFYAQVIAQRYDADGRGPSC